MGYFRSTFRSGIMFFVVFFRSEKDYFSLISDLKNNFSRYYQVLKIDEFDKNLLILIVLYFIISASYKQALSKVFNERLPKMFLQS